MVFQDRAIRPPRDIFDESVFPAYKLTIRQTDRAGHPEMLHLLSLERGAESRNNRIFLASENPGTDEQIAQLFLNFIEIFAKIGGLLEKTDDDDRRGIRETETHP